MSQRPVLPERRNPLLEEEHAPPHEILVERRCLGQTELKVKPGQVGTSNATKAENLGVLDYAHLRVPLPKDLTGSGIFSKTKSKWPEAYFLMRRSNDGFVSATGMFKAAFPFAQQEDEIAEKEYIKALEEASSEEVAGNVWIHPSKALELAEEYGISLWIAALLDPEDITHGASDPRKSIRSPPPYPMKDTANGYGRTPEPKRSTRGTRSLRSVSPSGASVTGKSQMSPRKKATPRKTTRDSRKTRGGTLSSVDEDDSKPEGVNGETVKVEVESALVPDAEGEELIETTKASIALPAGHKDLPLESPEEMMEQARAMVAEARKIQGTSGRRQGKRKAAELVDEEEEEVEELPVRPVKRQRPLEVELRKQRIQRRTWTGIAATLAIGALIPSVLNLL